MVDLANAKKGEAELDLKLEEGKLKLIISYDGAETDAKLEVASDIAKFIDKLNAAIPGDVDDAIGELLKAAIK